MCSLTSFSEKLVDTCESRHAIAADRTEKLRGNAFPLFCLPVPGHRVRHPRHGTLLRKLKTASMRFQGVFQFHAVFLDEDIGLVSRGRAE